MSLNVETGEKKYKPTPTEEKLLEVLLNPENRFKKISEICDMVGCDRKTYERAFKKQEFVDIYNNSSVELVKKAVGPVLNSFIREANRGSFQHGKVLLEMAGLYTETTKKEISGPNGSPIQTQSIDFDPATLSDEELAKVKEAVDILKLKK